MITTSDHHARRPVVAALLALVCSGLGHWYLGRPGIGLVIFAIPRLLSWSLIAAAAVLDRQLLGAVVFAILMRVSFWLWQVIWATWAAARCATPYRLLWINQPAVYAGVFATSLLLGTLVPELVVQDWFVGYHRAGGNSMVPTIRRGDWVVTNAFAHRITDLGRGEIIVFRDTSTSSIPAFQRKVFLGRVIGRSGDTVSFSGSVPVVNGVKLERGRCERRTGQVVEQIIGRPGHCFLENNQESRHYPIVSTDASKVVWGKDDYEDVVVPIGHYFILTDDRDDGRPGGSGTKVPGAIPQEALSGVVRGVLIGFQVPGGLDKARLLLSL